MIDLGLEGKRAVVAGAGWFRGHAGHGRLTTLRLAEAGAALACVDIDEGRAHEIVAEVQKAGGRAFPVVADMTERTQAERALDQAVRGLGGIDVCVDIIGDARWDRVEDVTVDDWAWAIDFNLTQVFYLFQLAGRHMIRQRTGGAMVALASVDGLTSAAFHAPYGAAKAGVVSLVKTFAHELGRHGIRANAVAPGNVGSGNEDQPEDQWATTSVNPLAAPRGRDTANAVLFLCSDLAVRITGQTLVVDGGATIRELWGLTEDLIPQFRAGNY
jgi:NAD(P)-dependent dehydrogenase (short-subunit alcohol dehydrogenase family)